MGQEEWDACAAGCGVVNPFLMHAFLLALEVTGCAVRDLWATNFVLICCFVMPTVNCSVRSD